MAMRKATLLAPTVLLAGAMMLPVGVTAASATPTHTASGAATQVNQAPSSPREDWREGWRDGYKDGKKSKRYYCKDSRKKYYDNYHRRGNRHYKDGYRRGWDKGWRDHRCSRR